MNQRKIVEELRIGPLTYRRFEADSTILGRTVHFGILRPGDFDLFTPERSAYCFHGGNGDDRQLIQEGVFAAIPPRVLEEISRRKIQLVTPFIGTSFLHDHPGDSSRAYFRHFIEEIVAGTEASFSDGVRERFLYGLSMGGFAALSAFFRRPGMFSGVAAQMPALFGFDFGNDEEVGAFVRRTGAPAEAVGFLLSLLKNEFQDQADYRSCDPITLAAQTSSEELAGKKILYEVGSADSFGCFEGAAELHQVLLREKIPHHYQLVEGGLHDAAFVINRFPALISSLFMD